MVSMFRELFAGSPCAFCSGREILKPKDLGISGARISALTPYDTLGTVNTLQTPPYSATGFLAKIKLNGETIKTMRWQWRTNLLWEEGTQGSLAAEAFFAVPPAQQCVVLALTLKNNSDGSLSFPAELWFTGSPTKTSQWTFAMPPAAGAGVQAETNGNGIVYLAGADGAAMALTCDPAFRLFKQARILQTRLCLAAGETRTLYFSFHLGDAEPVRKEAEAVRNQYPAWIDAAVRWVDGRETQLKNTLPAFGCADERYTQFYYRSLAVLLTNRWENPSLLSLPYYSTGGTTGGCMCSYLWDFAGAAKLLALTEPESLKEAIRSFLRIDLSAHYAVTPLDGSGAGPWYQINQEKIVYMIYYCLVLTGDSDFLFETVAGKTILEHAVFNARFGEDPADPAALIDYGEKGEDHLELKKGYPYHGVMPDLNLRRCLTYYRAAALLELAGQNGDDLRKKANEVYRAVKERLWNEERQWFAFVEAPGREKDYRYTVQMYKVLDSPVLDDEVRAGLLSHLNDTEFLSDFGLHSMSKLDPAYDQIDIDNGGGGICSLFVPVILEQLYRIGETEKANDLLSRVLWWGERTPYWGDSFVANAMEYRENTPLQATIGAAAGAEMFIFGLFGISVSLSGHIRVAPAAPPAKEMSLRDVRIRGARFSVFLNQNNYCVEQDGNRSTTAYGKSILLITSAIK